MAESPRALDCDLLVIGSGAGGLSSAVAAAHLGLDVIVIEKERRFGGTTAWSGGWMWVPRNPLAREAGIVEDIEEPRAYLKSELGNRYDDKRASAFLEHAPNMIAFFREKTSLRFVDGNTIPDFHGKAPHAGTGGRSVCAAPFDARRLGARVKDLRPPLDVVSPFGMGVASGADLRHFLNATFALASFRHVAKRVTRHVLDVALHGRGMHLVAGNALVAQLLKSADDLGVRLFHSTPARGLLREGRRVTGAQAGDDGELTIRARRGVLLACGGFPHDAERKAQLFEHAPSGLEHHSAAPLSNDGDGLRLGESVGGLVRDDLAAAGAWAPVSLVPRRDGSVSRFPHLVERAKPGLIAVTRRGERFANEANSYYDVMSALFSATPKGDPVEAWLVCDHAFIRRYGLGAVRPRPFPLGPWLANGYLKRGATPAELARACGVDADAFEKTLERYNTHARRGEDPAFGRGDTPYNRIQGESSHRPNPCVGPIERAPYYAVRIVPGSLGTFAGLATDENARVLDAARAPIAGLYAAGADMSSVMEGFYPAGGITLGPAMTFGFIAAHHAAGAALPDPA